MENNTTDIAAICQKHSDLVEATKTLSAIERAVEPYALRFHDFITRVMPRSPYSHKTNPLLTGEYGPLDFYEYAIDVVDPMPEAFSYYEPATACHFEVPYAYLADPDKWEEDQRAEYRAKAEVVEKAYHAFAPRVRDEMPEFHPLIANITEKNGEELALVYIVEGDNTGICLNQPHMDILGANVLSINLSTGEIGETNAL